MTASDKLACAGAALWLARTWWAWGRKPRLFRGVRRQPTARERAAVMDRAGHRCEQRYHARTFVTIATAAAIVYARYHPHPALLATGAVPLAVALDVTPLARCHRRRGLQVDHRIAYSRGGDHAVWNFAALCGHHNRAKSDRLTPTQKARAALGVVLPVGLAVMVLASCAPTPPGPVFIPPRPTTSTTLDTPTAVWICHDGTTRNAIASTEGNTPCPPVT